MLARLGFSKLGDGGFLYLNMFVIVCLRRGDSSGERGPGNLPCSFPALNLGAPRAATCDLEAENHCLLLDSGRPWVWACRSVVPVAELGLGGIDWSVFSSRAFSLNSCQDRTARTVLFYSAVLGFRHFIMTCEAFPPQRSCDTECSVLSCPTFSKRKRRKP